MPLLIACSSLIRTPELEEELEQLGFNMFLESPISNDVIGNLIQILKQRRENINEFKS